MKLNERKAIQLNELTDNFRILTCPTRNIFIQHIYDLNFEPRILNLALSSISIRQSVFDLRLV